MSELRWNPLLEEWVTVAPWRQDRTYHPEAAQCPLCPSRPGREATEVPEPDYHIAVFENRFPAYAGDGGRCEVVCYTSEHDSSLGAQPLDRIRDLVEVWQDRFRELSALPGVRFVYIFENRGQAIGVTLSHPHGQIYAYPFVPPVIARELAAFRRHRRRHGRCLLCDLVAAERLGPRLVVADDHWAAYVPAFARWPYEVHLAPTWHRPDILALTDAEVESMAAILREVLRRYDRLFGRALPYVMAMHQRPRRRAGSGGAYHLHVEFYPPNRSADRMKFLAGSELGAGAFIVDARAEDTAARLRDAV